MVFRAKKIRKLVFKDKKWYLTTTKMVNRAKKNKKMVYRVPKW